MIHKPKRHNTKQSVRRHRRPGKRKPLDSYQVFHEHLRLLGFSDYKAYLRSDIWQAFKAWYRSSKYPQRCLACGSKSVVLHHWTYLHLGHEDLQDVIPLCEDHHTALHRHLTASSTKLGDLKRQFVECFGLSHNDALERLQPFFQKRKTPKHHPRRDLPEPKPPKPPAIRRLCPRCGKMRSPTSFAGNIEFCTVCRNRAARRAKQKPQHNEPQRKKQRSALHLSLAANRVKRRDSVESLT